jgi:4-amino-4-deoxy-L-arabinose transferase-like glycosyltransferase
VICETRNVQHPRDGRWPQGFPAAIVIIFAVLGALWPGAKTQPLTAFDQAFYIGIAQDLRSDGTFTNGFTYEPDSIDQPGAPGMRFTPLYPALLAVAATVDPTFRRGMACLVTGRGQNTGCPRGATLVRTTQFLMLGLFYLLLWWMGRTVLGTDRAAWISLAIALLTAPDLLNYVNYVMTEITALTLATAATAAALRGLNETAHKLRWFVLAGLLAGLSALTRPAFLYLVLLCGLAGLIGALLNRNRASNTRMAIAFLLAAGLIIAPWIARNAMVMGEPALTAGYGPHVLNERIAFDAMTWHEYALSFLCWLPDGNGMGSLLIGPGACHRFQLDLSPDTFYGIGNGTLMRQSLAASGGWPQMTGYLLRTYIVPHPLKHGLVTLSLALRGLWISHYWGFVLAPVCLVVTAKAWRRRDLPFLAISLPAWFMLLFAAAVSVNQTRYNLMLILPFALSGAVAVEALIRRNQATSVASSAPPPG